jgi:RNA polymerase sigma-70 factor (ECF subfamily)
MEQKDFEIEVTKLRSRLLHEASRFLDNKEDVEDVTQEVLLKLWSMRQELDKYRSVEALAITITKHLCLNRLRSTVYPMTDWNKEDISNGSSPEDTYIEKEEEELVMKLMKTLPNAQQVTLRMKHVDGLEVKEIARITGSSELAVRTNLSRARRKMLDYFGINK